VRIEHRLDNYDFTEEFDLVIIGGGANGAGVARDASERGLKVLLLEKNDFCSGCSGHSTRLIHGGLRYLEHLEFGLVHESLQERELLLQLYPHLVNPIGLLIPSYAGNKTALWKLKIGMWLYDWLSHNKSLSKHRSFSKEELKKLDLEILNKKLEGAVYYYDAQIPLAERLVLENILSAEFRGAICLNYCEVTEIICEKQESKYQATTVKFKDKLNGMRPYTARAKNIINIAGPWVDKINTRLKDSKTFALKTELKKRIGGTKGSHIVVKNFKGAPKDFGIYSEARSDHRPFFILPFKLGMNDTVYLIGTTDIFVSETENIDNPEISQKEITYLLNETNELFPQARLQEKDIINTYSGIRPLPYQDKSKKEGTVTRKHFIVNHEKELVKNFYSIIGGKWTTFRNLAKEITSLFTTNNCFTHEKRTIGAQYPEDKTFSEYIQESVQEFSRKYDIPAHTIIHLITLYGTQAKCVLDLCQENPLLKDLINKDYEDIEAQIIYAIRYEHAYTVEDILKRRLTIGLITNQFDQDIIKTIKHHLENEFELYGRNRDKVLQELILGEYKE
jgi:glycerol-3-phosphate dehydrogenase